MFLGSVNRNCTFRMFFLLLLLHTYYMFRPLRPIFRWNIYTAYFTKSYFYFSSLILDNFVDSIAYSVFMNVFRILQSYLVEYPNEDASSSEVKSSYINRT
jgi:hypothetical protein